MNVAERFARGAKKGTGGHAKISSRAAGVVARAEGVKLPRPGYVVDLSTTTYNGYRGNWMLSNYAGKYELAFHYHT